MNQEFRSVAHSFTWKVEDYRAKVEAVKPGQFIVSPEFCVDDPLDQANSFRFLLNLYPNGWMDQNHVGLFLKNADAADVVLVGIKLIMLDENGHELVKKESDKAAHVIRDMGRFWGTLLFATRSSVETIADKDLVSGSVTFVCELKLRLPAIKYDEAVPSLGDALFDRLKRGVLTDVTLVCGEQRFKCHKLLLATRSSVFEEMFENTDHDNRDEISIDNTEPHVLEKMLEFMYTNRVDLSEHDKELFIAADRFSVMGLKKAAECKFMNELTIANVAEVLTLFDTYVCETEGFEDKAVKYAMRNLSAVMKTDAWQKVTEAHPRLVRKAFAEMAAKRDSTR